MVQHYKVNKMHTVTNWYTGDSSQIGKSSNSLLAWDVVGSNPEQAKKVAYKMYALHCLALCSALIGYYNDWFAQY